MSFNLKKSKNVKIKYEETQKNINNSSTGPTTMVNNQIKTFNLKKAQGFQEQATKNVEIEFNELWKKFNKVEPDSAKWHHISRYKFLSEDFMRKFQDKLNWINISLYQRLPNSFIREFRDKLDLSYLLVNNQISQEFYKELKGEVQDNIKIPFIGPTTMVNNQIKTFDLKKAQAPQGLQPPMDTMGLNDTPELMGDKLDELGQIREEEQNIAPENPKFKDGNDVRNWLDQTDFTFARPQLMQFIEDINKQQLLEDSLNAYYETDLNSNERLQLSANIFDLLPDNLKEFDINDPNTIMAPYTSANVINNEIKKLAENCINNKKTKTFNLNKTAQHKSFDNNVIMYGPGQTRLDPFYRQPVSDYSIVERNKGFGFVVDDIWNIDWETIWRGSIMDKYSRPYRNKEGKWVGGYINKRFEVDNWVPETNNYQLKPGERRKPYLPEYASTEARLQDARHKGIIKGGPQVNRSAPFNWKEASSKKKS